MRTTFAFFLAMVFFAPAVFSQTDSTKVLRVEDPTQMFTYMDISAGINFVANGTFVEPNNWAFDYRAVLGGKKFRTGFTLPFSNYANEYTGLGDIGIDFGYKLHQSKGVYTATTLNAGVNFPTSFTDYYQGGNIAWLGTPQAFFTFFANYTSSIRITKDLYLYPKLEYYQREHINNGYTIFGQGDSAYNPPNHTQHGWKLQLDASYRFNAKSFLSGYIGYQPETWAFRQNGSAFLGPASFEINNLNFGLVYQLAFTPASQMYFRIDSTIRGLNLPDYREYGNYKGNYFVRVGYKYFFGM